MGLKADVAAVRRLLRYDTSATPASAADILKMPPDRYWAAVDDLVATGAVKIDRLGRAVEIPRSRRK